MRMRGGRMEMRKGNSEELWVCLMYDVSLDVV